MRVFGRSRVSMRKVTRLGQEVEALWQQRRFGELKANKAKGRRWAVGRV